MGVVDGLRVEVVGEGDPVVLLHGALGWGAQTFAAQYVLADSYRLHVVDRRGYGGSPHQGEVGWPVDVPDLLALLESLGGAHVLGHSYGGVVALVAAGRRPDLVRSLVVVEPPMYGISEHPEAQSLTEDLWGLAGRAPDQDGAEFFADWADLVLGLHPRLVSITVNSWTDLDRIAAEATRIEAMPLDPPVEWDGVRRITGPAVVVSGGWPPETARASTDPKRIRAATAFRETAREVAQRLGVAVTEFEESGHNPQLTDSTAFNALLRETWAATSHTSAAGGGRS
jgi:pimeloyl-ACP methyl ester carboxylesterase